MYWKSANTGNSQFLKQFLQQLQANNPSKKLLIILDNARFHISKYIKDYLRNHKNIVMFFLPTYSPEYNPIERFWLWLKQKVYGFKSFDYIEDILSTIRKTIWCYNENRMKSKINFKMSIYENIL